MVLHHDIGIWPMDYRGNWGVNQSVGVGVGVGVGALMGWWAWRRYSLPDLPTQWEEAGEVSGLVIYPLKSGAGINVNQAEATPYGLEYGLVKDRTLLIVTEDGKFVTGRQVPKLTTFTLAFRGASVTITAPDATSPFNLDLEEVIRADRVMDAIVFNAGVRGYDCGDAASDWMTEVLHGAEGKRLRLIYNADLTTQRVARMPPFYNFKQYKKSDRVVYADTCAYMLASESSLADLNTRLATPVTMNWFRANFHVRGSQPYDEDDWAFIKLGEVVLRRIKPCDRCIFTTVDPAKGAKTTDQEPIATLKTYRLQSEPEAVAKAWATKPVFGSHMSIDQCGTVRVGDKVQVARASSNRKWNI